MPTRPRPTHAPGRFPIRTVAERTGLTPAAIRAWERRYRIVEPARSDGAQRLYSDADVERLRLVTTLSAAGYSLADLAQHSTDALSRMAAGADATGSASAAVEPEAAPHTPAVDRMIESARALDVAGLRAMLMQSLLELGPIPALDRVLTPVLTRLGEGWACGDVSVAEEHVASSVIRDVLGWLLQSAVPAPGAPALIATTVAGEGHEFGAMMAAVVAAVAGWRVLYLGANTPAEDLARAARDSKARVIAVGIVADEAADSVRAEVTTLRRKLGPKTKIFAGGAAAVNHRLSLKRAGIEVVESRAKLRRRLAALWTRDT